MKRLELYVGKNGHYADIKSAIEAVPYHTPASIYIAQGIYTEKLFIDKKDIEIIGEGADETIISIAEGANTILEDGKKRGTFRTYTVFAGGESVVLKNLSIKNEAGDGRKVGQSIALYADADRLYGENIILDSYQDTLFIAPLPEKEREVGGFFGPRVYNERKMSRVYLRDSTIIGDIDFIFGGGDALFEHCILHSRNRGEEINGYVAAPSTEKESIGFVFADCKFVSQEGVAKESVYLARAWREYAKASFINCSYGEHIHREGFIAWNGKGEVDALASYQEYISDARQYRALSRRGSKPMNEQEACMRIEAIRRYFMDFMMLQPVD